MVDCSWFLDYESKNTSASSGRSHGIALLDKQFPPTMPLPTPRYQIFRLDRLIPFCTKYGASQRVRSAIKMCTVEPAGKPDENLLRWGEPEPRSN